MKAQSSIFRMFATLAILIAVVSPLIGCAHLNIRPPTAPPEAIPTPDGTVSNMSNAVTAPTALDDLTGGPVLRRLAEDSNRLMTIATAANDPIGIQCSIDITAFVVAVSSFGGVRPTGYFFADIERQRVMRKSSLIDLLRKANDSCAPLLVGPEKFGAALGLPRALLDILNGR